MPTTITVSECDDGNRLRVHVGDTLEIRLPENASTGYRWVLDDLDTEMFERKDSGAGYPCGRIGCAGEATFRMVVRAKGKAVVRLTCCRKWEGERGVRKLFAVTVVADD